MRTSEEEDKALREARKKLEYGFKVNARWLMTRASVSDIEWELMRMFRLGWQAKLEDIKENQ